MHPVMQHFASAIQSGNIESSLLFLSYFNVCIKFKVAFLLILLISNWKDAAHCFAKHSLLCQARGHNSTQS